MRFAFMVALWGSLLASQAAFGQDGAATTAPTTTSAPATQGAWTATVIANIDKAVSLTDEQKTKIRELLLAQQAAHAQWQKANAEKIQAAQDAIKKARDSGDEAAIRKAFAGWKDIGAAQTEVLRKYDITTVMTPEQKIKWGVDRLVYAAQARYKTANLTEEQWTKIKAAAEELVKKSDLSDPTTHMAAMSALDVKVRELMTQEQKDAMEKASGPHIVPASRPMPPAAPPVPPPDKAVGG